MCFSIYLHKASFLSWFVNEKIANFCSRPVEEDFMTSDQVILSSQAVALLAGQIDVAFYVTSSPGNLLCASVTNKRKKREVNG